MSLQQRRLEGQYRDVYLNKKLADRWRNGDYRAAISCQGIPLSHDECHRIDRQFLEVRFIAPIPLKFETCRH
jgi:hypothetical protein